MLIYLIALFIMNFLMHIIYNIAPNGDISMPVDIKQNTRLKSYSDEVKEPEKKEHEELSGYSAQVSAAQAMPLIKPEKDRSDLSYMSIKLSVLTTQLSLLTEEHAAVLEMIEKGQGQHHSSLDKKLDRLAKEMDALNKKISQIEISSSQQAKKQELNANEEPNLLEIISKVGFFSKRPEPIQVYQEEEQFGYESLSYHNLI